MYWLAAIQCIRTAGIDPQDTMFGTAKRPESVQCHGEWFDSLYGALQSSNNVIIEYFQSICITRDFHINKWIQ
jgi:hypothetical protein